MSEPVQGPVADAGRTVQRGLNQAGDTKDEVTRFIRDNPICAVLLAAGIGYLLGKIV
jgi:ElaB/YqjD/DUF883 family membrane-anchored ribosome-binding protein